MSVMVGKKSHPALRPAYEQLPWLPPHMSPLPSPAQGSTALLTSLWNLLMEEALAHMLPLQARVVPQLRQRPQEDVMASRVPIVTQICYNLLLAQSWNNQSRAWRASPREGYHTQM